MNLHKTINLTTGRLGVSQNIIYRTDLEAALRSFNQLPEPYDISFSDLIEFNLLFKQIFTDLYTSNEHGTNDEEQLSIYDLILETRNKVLTAFSEPVTNYYMYQKLLVESGKHPDMINGYIIIPNKKNVKIESGYWIQWEHEMIGMMYIMNRMGRLSSGVLKRPKELRDKIRGTGLFEDLDFRRPMYKALAAKVKLIGDVIYASPANDK
jgi:hypothetical protein